MPPGAYSDTKPFCAQTKPHYNLQVSELEFNGYITKFKTRLESDEQVLTAMYVSHVVTSLA
jgi:hypothetical protein